MPIPKNSRQILLCAAFVALASLPAGAGEVRQVLPGAPAPLPPQELTREAAPALDASALDPNASEVQRFCSNIADAARDRRYALQAAELQQLQGEVDKRIKALEEKRLEYETWLKRREVFLARAEEGVVSIYSGMKPDAAAERLAMVEAELAAAILMKLDARKASVILNEMDQKAAARLTSVMASAARRTDPS
ncbi:MotE family protein [Aquamicrobium terrae]|uniref:Flagellar motility protein MotE (MotC chaperone) n=1 Tax=Aquamicrobium terrae TaxID=1324945 RepID=A0ABV2MXX5_9HYPH